MSQPRRPHPSLRDGMYLSVDYSLAIDTLPNRDDAARWLAIWGLASFLGTTIGPGVSGPVLYFMKGNLPQGADPGVHPNTVQGYTALLIIGCVWMCGCTVFLALVKGAR